VTKGGTVAERGSVLVVGLQPEVHDALAAALSAEASCRALSRASDAAEGMDARPAVAAVSLDSDAPGALRLITRLATNGTRVIALGPTKDADLILRAMRAGANEFALSTDAEQIATAVRSQLRPVSPVRLGSVTTVFAAKGGVGATTIAVNLAGALQQRGQRVCVLDLDVNLGDVLAFLDVAGTYSVSDVAANMHRLDRELLDSSLPRHRSGLHLLAQGEKLEEADRIDGPMIGKLVEFLRHLYDWVVIDGIRAFDEIPLAALDVSERILLVVTQEVPAVRNARRCANIFRRLGYGDGRVQLVVNRHQARARIPDAAIEETTGLPVAARLSNDFAAASEAIHRGALVAEAAPRSPLKRDMEALATLLGGPAGSAEHRPSSLLKRLFSPRTVPDGA
jgi:pilus assembly protein CpaE